MHLCEQRDGASERKTGEGDEVQAPGPSSCLIHRNAWKGYSPNFGLTAFSEGRSAFDSPGRLPNWSGNSATWKSRWVSTPHTTSATSFNSRLPLPRSPCAY